MSMRKSFFLSFLIALFLISFLPANYARNNNFSKNSEVTNYINNIDNSTDNRALLALPELALPSNSCQTSPIQTLLIITAQRLVENNWLMKEITAHSYYKNQVLVLENIIFTLFALKSKSDYYTVGQGKLRV